MLGRDQKEYKLENMQGFKIAKIHHEQNKRKIHALPQAWHLQERVEFILRFINCQAHKKSWERVDKDDQRKHGFTK